MKPTLRILLIEVILFLGLLLTAGIYLSKHCLPCMLNMDPQQFSVGCTVSMCIMIIGGITAYLHLKKKK